MHERNDICIDFQERMGIIVAKHEDRISTLEKTTAVSNLKIDNVCVKLDNLTKVLWWLVGTFVTTLLGLIAAIITKLV